MLSIGQNAVLSQFTKAALCLMAAMFSSMAFASANRIQSLDEIMRQVDKYLTAQYPSSESRRFEFDMRPPDKRLRLPKCLDALTIASIGPKTNVGTLTVRVTCPSPRWEIYVSGRRLVYHKVWVTTKPLLRDEYIYKGALKTDWRRYHPHMVDSSMPEQALIGARVMRPFRTGDALTRPAICLVCKGDKVEIIARSGNLVVKTKGMAQQNGLLGETVTAYNMKTRRPVTAKVIKQGVLLIELGG